VKRTWSVVSTVAALIASISLNAGWNATGGAATWPKQLAGHLLDHPQKSLPYGSAVTKSHLLIGWMGSKNYEGAYSYALADVGDYEYPVSTVDHGKQWRIAGEYFNLDDTSGMGAGSSPSNIVTLSPTIAIAYRRGDIIGPVSAMYVTVDSGRKWYVAFAPGPVKKLTAVLAKPNHSALQGLTASVSSVPASGRERDYTSLNGGRTWSLVTAPFVATSDRAVSPATAVLRALLNMAIVPPNATLVHPAKSVLCRCAGTTADAQYLVTMHRFYVVPGSPSSVEAFLATHIPKSGVEGGEGIGGVVITNSTDFPANGPRIYLRQLAYSMATRNASSSWLRIDSVIISVPRRSASQAVSGAASATATSYKSVNLDGSRGATKVDVSGSGLTDLLSALNSLPLGPQNDCVEDLTGFNLNIALKNGDTVDVYNGFCGGPTDLVSVQKGNLTESRYSLSDTSCTLIKDVVSLFGSAPIAGTRNALHSCETWMRHPVA
jgi:hypothetical protein